MLCILKNFGSLSASKCSVSWWGVQTPKAAWSLLSDNTVEAGAARHTSTPYSLLPRSGLQTILSQSIIMRHFIHLPMWERCKCCIVPSSTVILVYFCSSCHDPSPMIPTRWLVQLFFIWCLSSWKHSKWKHDERIWKAFILFGGCQFLTRGAEFIDWTQQFRHFDVFSLEIIKEAWAFEYLCFNFDRICGSIHPARVFCLSNLSSYLAVYHLAVDVWSILELWIRYESVTWIWYVVLCHWNHAKTILNNERRDIISHFNALYQCKCENLFGSRPEDSRRLKAMKLWQGWPRQYRLTCFGYFLVPGRLCPSVVTLRLILSVSMAGWPHLPRSRQSR